MVGEEKVSKEVVEEGLSITHNYLAMAVLE